MTAGPEGRQTTFFYGWMIVLAAFIANFMGAGLGFYIFNAFLEPLTRLHGWTRTDINLGPMLGYIVSVIAGLLYGTIVTRVGARAIMCASSIVTALSFYFLGVSDNLALFYLFYMLMMMGIGGMNGIVSATAVNNWFIAKRGRAMGIATAAISLSGVILTPAAMLILEAGGLESAFLVISLCIALVAPIVWLLVRNRPEDKGLHPDGIMPVTAWSRTGRENGHACFQAPSHWTIAMFARSGNFWKIGIAYGLSMASVLGVMYQLKPRFSDIGFDTGSAVALMAGTALAGAVGKYAWAHLCDHFKAKNVAAILMACNAAGLCLMFAVNSMATALAFVIFYGFAMGGVVSTQPVIIAEFFGRDAYPSIARYVGVIVGIDCIGYPIMGRSFDLSRSYDAAYGIFILFNIMAATLLFILKKKG
ncbi:MAG TPA: MFS transporter [Spirochaetota bacterium]|nr:MFS transporter [Spirochaetota bacterium]